MGFLLPSRDQDRRDLQAYIAERRANAALQRQAPYDDHTKSYDDHTRRWISPVGWLAIGLIALTLVLLGVIGGLALSEPDPVAVNAELADTVRALSDELKAERAERRRMQAEAEIERGHVIKLGMAVIIGLIFVGLGIGFGGPAGGAVVFVMYLALCGVVSGAIQI